MNMIPMLGSKIEIVIYNDYSLILCHFYSVVDQTTGRAMQPGIMNEHP